MRQPRWTRIPSQPYKQLADWLESYAKTMDLNIWTSSTVTFAEKDISGAWVVNVTRILSDGTESKRVLRPTHVVSALGFGGGSLNIPKYPKQVVSPGFVRAHVRGLIQCCLQEEFEGEVMHAFQFTSARKYAGKKVVVVGAATTGHDIAFDLANHGIGQ